jgi:hypothetical protein
MTCRFNDYPNSFTTITGYGIRLLSLFIILIGASRWHPVGAFLLPCFGFRDPLVTLAFLFPLPLSLPVLILLFL